MTGTTWRVGKGSSLGIARDAEGYWNASDECVRGDKSKWEWQVKTGKWPKK